MGDKTILIVEDDEDIQELYKAILLEAFDVNLKRAMNGQEGLEALKGSKPDLIILDILMPIMSGDVFLKHLRYDLGIKDIPVVICSVNQGLANELLEKREIEATLPKLFPPKKLVELVSRFLAIKPKDGIS